VQGNANGCANINTAPDIGASTKIQKQWLATVVEELAFIGGAGLERHHFLAELFHAGHKAEHDRVIVFGQE